MLRLSLAAMFALGADDAAAPGGVPAAVEAPAASLLPLANAAWDAAALFVAGPGAGAGAGAGEPEDWVALPLLPPVTELIADVTAVIVRLTADCTADLAAIIGLVTAFAVVVQVPAESLGLSSQVEKLTAAPV